MALEWKTRSLILELSKRQQENRIRWTDRYSDADIDKLLQIEELVAIYFYI